MKISILIALGGAHNVWDDLESAKKLISELPHDVGAAKWSGSVYEGHLTLWCSLHPEKIPEMQRRRSKNGLNTDYLSITHKGSVGRQFGNGRVDEVIRQTFRGCSGLYLAQIALLSKGYEKVICCGMPNEATPHFTGSKPWEDYHRYRRGWMEALRHPVMVECVRSMSGWTAEVFGRPNRTWIEGTA